MGGGGGGGGPGISADGWGGGDGGAKSCETLRFSTTLASPQEQIIAELSVGDQLQVRLVTESGEQPYAGAFTRDGAMAGVIFSSHIGQLIGCLTSGHEYMAQIIQVDFPACMVDVFHR